MTDRLVSGAALWVEAAGGGLRVIGVELAAAPPVVFAFAL